MAYELVHFAPPENRPRFLKIVGATVAIAIIAGLTLVELSPLSPQYQDDRHNEQMMLEQSQKDLKGVEAWKASGKRWFISDLTVDQAIQNAQQTVAMHKERLTKLSIAENESQVDKLRTSGIISAILGVIIGSIYFGRSSYKSMFEAAKADLKQRGHNADYQVGQALIDSKSKVIAFVDLGAKTYDFYSLYDILGYEHQWIDKIDGSTNVWGDKIRANTRQASNQLVFKTNNPAKPLYKVPLPSHRAGEEWMARLGAIISAA